MSLKSLCILAVAALFTGAAPAAASDCAGFQIDDDTILGPALCLPARPERVVVLDPSFSLGIGLDVGLPIVGAPLSGVNDADLAARAAGAGIADLGFPTAPSLERMVALQPDLIVGFIGDEGLAAAIHPMFSQIAPTMLETEIDWPKYYRSLARLSGQEDHIDGLFAEFETRLAALRPRVPADTTVSVLRITSWDFQVYPGGPDGYAPFALLHQAGVKRSDYEMTQVPEGVLRPDWEQLAGLTGDILLYIVGGTNQSDSDGRHEEVLNHPLWQLLPAVQAGNVHRIEHGTWMEFSGLGSAHKVLDDIERYVIGTP